MVRENLRFLGSLLMWQAVCELSFCRSEGYIEHYHRCFNPENSLDLIFVASPCKKIIIVPDTNYITPPIKKLMLDIPSPDGF